MSEFLEVKDFSGGITDNIFAAPINKYKTADNLLIELYQGMGKLRIRNGCKIFNEGFSIPNLYRINHLRYVRFENSGVSAVFAFRDLDVYYTLDSGAGFGAWVKLLGPTGSNPITANTNDFGISTYVWRDQLIVSHGQKLPFRIFLDNLNVPKAVTIGTPTRAAITGSAAGGAIKYLYRVLYSYEYTVGGRKYIDRGDFYQTSVSTNAISPSNTVLFASISPFVNGAGQNYDTGSLKFLLEFYRTTGNGQNFFFAGSIQNGTTTFTDDVTDAILQTREPLYTEGGLPTITPPPRALINHLVGDTGYYANCDEFDTYGQPVDNVPERLYQSIPGSPGNVPADFYEDFSSAIKGFSSHKSIRVIMLDGGEVYRLEGGIDETGAGSYEKVELSKKASCLNHLSVVQTDVGLFWAGVDGFYFSDGYQCFTINKDIDETYAGFTYSDICTKYLRGRYDKIGNRVYWSINEDESSSAKRYIILHLDFGVSESMPFTTMSGQFYFEASAHEFVGDSMLRGSEKGLVYLHEPGIATDTVQVPQLSYGPVKDTILYDFLSAAHDFGTSSLRKFVTSMSVVCKNVTNLSLGIRSINDAGKTLSDLKPIRFRGSLTWGDPSVIWGDPTLIWNRNGVISEKRRFPGNGLRCMYKQIGFKNAKVVIIISDFLGLADYNATFKTLTRTSNWPTNILNQVIAFEQDGFKKEYEIVLISGNVLTISDSSNTLLTKTGTRWVVRGTPQAEFLFLSSYDLEYTILSRSMRGFRKESTGEPS